MGELYVLCDFVVNLNLIPHYILLCSTLKDACRKDGKGTFEEHSAK